MDIETAIDDLVSWEGYITWMYLDTAGHVTIGIGHMIPDVSSAMLLPFIHGNDEHAAATGAEISVAYEVVRAWPAAHVAGYYAAASELRLPPWHYHEAAAECHRSSCRDERNAWTRELFLRAARESAPTGKHRIV